MWDGPDVTIPPAKSSQQPSLATKDSGLKSQDQSPSSQTSSLVGNSIPPLLNHTLPLMGIMVVTEVPLLRKLRPSISCTDRYFLRSWGRTPNLSADRFIRVGLVMLRGDTTSGRGERRGGAGRVGDGRGVMSAGVVGRDWAGICIDGGVEADEDVDVGDEGRDAVGYLLRKSIEGGGFLDRCGIRSDPRLFRLRFRLWRSRKKMAVSRMKISVPNPPTAMPMTVPSFWLCCALCVGDEDRVGSAVDVVSGLGLVVVGFVGDR